MSHDIAFVNCNCCSPHFKTFFSPEDWAAFSNDFDLFNFDFTVTVSSFRRQIETQGDESKSTLNCNAAKAQAEPTFIP